MTKELIKHDILEKIRRLAAESSGRAPGSERFQAETGIKPNTWRGKIWRSWSDALVEAGFEPNVMQRRFDDDALLSQVLDVAKSLGRFPSTGDLAFEFNARSDFAHPDVVFGRWKMTELAAALRDFAEIRGELQIVDASRAYLASRSADQTGEDGNDDLSVALGFVYMQRHGSDYKIGFTKSLNKRGRQIQIELPQEIELVHSILTDDPVGVEGYWHRRFADKRTRGEWFKLAKADVAAFKRWSKIW